MSTFMRAQIAAVFGTAIASAIPTLLFSEMLIPVSALTGPARVMGYGFPSAWFHHVSVGIFTKGLGVADLWPGLDVHRPRSTVNFRCTRQANISDSSIFQRRYQPSPIEKPPCPMWKKATAGVLVVAAVALFAAMWLASPGSPATESITGLSMILAISLGLVVGGVAVVTLLLWILSRFVNAILGGDG
jgi:hypothetical protein